MHEFYRYYQSEGETKKTLVVSRTEETQKKFAEEMERIRKAKKSLPFYESRPKGNTAEMPPEGFRDVHKSIGEWKQAYRKLKPGARPIAYVASWWQPMPSNPSRWVEVYHIGDTVFIKGRSVGNIMARLDAGESIDEKEKATLLKAGIACNEHDEVNL